MAKTLEEINLVVFNFAHSTSDTITPTILTDPIVPAPLAMTDELFNRFFFNLLNALTVGGIIASVPMDGLRACIIWFNVSTLIFHHQRA